MDYTILICFIPIIIALIIADQLERKQMGVIKNIRKKRKEKLAMSEIIKNYVGKNCIVTTMSGSEIIGIITAAEDGWINVDNGKMNQAVNLDYITKISEKPVKKKN
ncbi:MAG: hypothetical protein NC110_06540 [Ruminococcus sp.]|nr:hypothetical protein [Ruminococcus sp.]